MNKFDEYKEEGKAPYIPMDELKPFYFYRIRARNARYGIWLPKEQGFMIRREKFGDYFTFIEYHWNTGAPFGTVRPLKELEPTGFIHDDFLNKKVTRGGNTYFMEAKYYEIMEYLETKTEEYDNVKFY